MEDLLVDTVIHLRQDVPELALTRGKRGVIRSIWFAPFTRYEVEFGSPDEHSNTRALLSLEQVEVDHDVTVAAMEHDLHHAAG